MLVDKGEHSKQLGIFDTKVYFESNVSHALLHKKSFHLKQTFAGIIKSELVHIGRICQLESDFNEANNILFKALNPRDYTLIAFSGQSNLM